MQIIYYNKATGGVQVDRVVASRWSVSSATRGLTPFHYSKKGEGYVFLPTTASNELKSERAVKISPAKAVVLSANEVLEILQEGFTLENIPGQAVISPESIADILKKESLRHEKLARENGVVSVDVANERIKNTAKETIFAERLKIQPKKNPKRGGVVLSEEEERDAREDGFILENIKTPDAFPVGQSDHEKFIEKEKLQKQQEVEYRKSASKRKDKSPKVIGDYDTMFHGRELAAIKGASFREDDDRSPDVVPESINIVSSKKKGQKKVSKNKKTYKNHPSILATKAPSSDTAGPDADFYFPDARIDHDSQGGGQYSIGSNVSSDSIAGVAGVGLFMVGGLFLARRLLEQRRRNRNGNSSGCQIL